MGTNSLKITLLLENFTKKILTKYFFHFFSDFLLEAHDGIYWTASLRLLR